MYMYIFKVCLVNKCKIKLLVFINYINFIIEREKNWDRMSGNVLILNFVNWFI